jgi:hypothetical protein
LSEITDPALRGYRALWNYLAGSAAWLGWKESGVAMEQTAREYFQKASDAAPAVPWLINIGRSKTQLDATPTIDLQLLNVIERTEIVLAHLGTLHNRKYDQEEKYILDGLSTGTSALFEDAHKRLGTILGYETGNVETPGSPDPWWVADSDLCFVFEDHSDAQADSTLSISKARQAATHPNWVRAKQLVADKATIVSVIVSPVKAADGDTLLHLGEVSLWSLSDFRAWAKNAMITMRELRRSFPGAGDLAWRAEAVNAYRKNNMDPQGLLKLLLERPAAQLLKS